MATRTKRVPCAPIPGVKELPVPDARGERALKILRRVYPDAVYGVEKEYDENVYAFEHCRDTICFNKKTDQWSYRIMGYGFRHTGEQLIAIGKACNVLNEERP